MADQTITESSVSCDSIIESPVAPIWSTLIDFTKWNEWCDSFVYMNTIESKEGNRPTREFQMISKMIYSDELLNADSSNHTLTYNLLSVTPAMPALVSTVTTIKLDVLSENQTKITWSSVTKTIGMSQEIIEKVNGMKTRGYNKHIESLAAHVATKQVSGL